jgi:hypothetical protein
MLPLLVELDFLVDCVSEVLEGHLDLVEREVEDLLAFVTRTVLELLEEGMVQAILCGIARLGVVDEHVVEQVQNLFTSLRSRAIYFGEEELPVDFLPVWDVLEHLVQPLYGNRI